MIFWASYISFCLFISYSDFSKSSSCFNLSKYSDSDTISFWNVFTFFSLAYFNIKSRFYFSWIIINLFSSCFLFSSDSSCLAFFKILASKVYSSWCFFYSYNYLSLSWASRTALTSNFLLKLASNSFLFLSNSLSLW